MAEYKPSIHAVFVVRDVFFSFAAVLIKPPPLKIDDPILAALSAGVICGVGGGVVFRSQGSGGGLDVLAVYLRRQFLIWTRTHLWWFMKHRKY